MVGGLEIAMWMAAGRDEGPIVMGGQLAVRGPVR